MSTSQAATPGRSRTCETNQIGSGYSVAVRTSKPERETWKGIGFSVCVVRRSYRQSSPVMREVTTRGEDGWKSRSKGSSSWSASIAAAGRDGGGRAGGGAAGREGKTAEGRRLGRAGL